MNMTGAPLDACADRDLADLIDPEWGRHDRPLERDPALLLAVLMRGMDDASGLIARVDSRKSRALLQAEAIVWLCDETDAEPTVDHFPAAFICTALGISQRALIARLLFGTLPRLRFLRSMHRPNGNRMRQARGPRKAA